LAEYINITKICYFDGFELKKYFYILTNYTKFLFSRSCINLLLVNCPGIHPRPTKSNGQVEVWAGTPWEGVLVLQASAGAPLGQADAVDIKTLRASILLKSMVLFLSSSEIPVLPLLFSSQL